MNEVTKIDGAPEVLPTQQDDAMLSMIERVITDPELPMDRLTALLDIRERQMAKEAEQAFNAAFASAMAEMPDVRRTGRNNHTGKTYATLDDLIRTARPVLARHGLSLNWHAGEAEGGMIVVKAVVRHALGHSISTEQRGPRDSGKQMNALQGGGSTETYLKRYTGFSLLGLSTGDEVDDDGRTADAGGPISEEQYRELRELLGQKGVSEEVVCTSEGVDALAALPASRLAAVKKRLAQTPDKKAA